MKFLISILFISFKAQIFYPIGQQLEERQEDYNYEDYELPDPDMYGDLDEIIQQKLNPTNAPAISTNGRLLIPFCFYAQRSVKCTY